MINKYTIRHPLTTFSRAILFGFYQIHDSKSRKEGYIDYFDLNLSIFTSRPRHKNFTNSLKIVFHNIVPDFDKYYLHAGDLLTENRLAAPKIILSFNNIS